MKMLGPDKALIYQHKSKKPASDNNGAGTMRRPDWNGRNSREQIMASLPLDIISSSSFGMQFK